MKFLCIDCDAQMTFEERQQPGDGTFTASFACPRCGRRVAMLANPMETQLVSTLGVEIGGRTLDERPLEFTRANLAGRDNAFTEDPPRAPRPLWSSDAEERLASVPSFVRGMVKTSPSFGRRSLSIAHACFTRARAVRSTRSRSGTSRANSSSHDRLAAPDDAVTVQCCEIGTTTRLNLLLLSPETLTALVVTMP